MGLTLKNGDTVEIRSGKDRSTKDAKKRGKVLKMMWRKGRHLVFVEGYNKVTKSLPKSDQNPKGEMVKVEAPLDISNVMLVCPKCNKITRIKAYQEEGRKKVRQCAKCEKTID